MVSVINFRSALDKDPLLASTTRRLRVLRFISRKVIQGVSVYHCLSPCIVWYYLVILRRYLYYLVLVVLVTCYLSISFTFL